MSFICQQSWKNEIKALKTIYFRVVLRHDGRISCRRRERLFLRIINIPPFLRGNPLFLARTMGSHRPHAQGHRASPNFQGPRRDRAGTTFLGRRAECAWLARAPAPRLPRVSLGLPLPGPVAPAPREPPRHLRIHPDLGVGSHFSPSFSWGSGGGGEFQITAKRNA